MFLFQKKHYFCEFGRVYNALTSIKKYFIKRLKNRRIENKKLGISPLLVAEAFAGGHSTVEKENLINKY